jgi:predicted transcriptional regulator
MDSLNPKKRPYRVPLDIVVPEDKADKISINVVQARKFPKDWPDFVMLFTVANGIISRQLRDPGSRVLLYMISLQQYGNHVGVNQNDIADALKISRTSVWRALKQLKELNVLIDYPDPQSSNRNVYIISPHYNWKGDNSKRTKLLKENPKQFKLFFEVPEDTTPPDNS